MSATEVTYKYALNVLGMLPHLSPCTTTTNIQALVINLINKLTITPYQQSPDFGYLGMIEADGVYALKTTTARKKCRDPGVHRPLNDAWNGDKSKNQGVIYDANKKVFDSHTNVQRAVINTLNTAVTCV